jgi:hypothetical protein
MVPEPFRERLADLFLAIQKTGSWHIFSKGDSKESVQAEPTSLGIPNISSADFFIGCSVQQLSGISATNR